MQPTDLTVSAVIERDGKYLMIEEVASGAVVLNQPGGHLESGESPEEAVTREVLEETGHAVDKINLREELHKSMQGASPESLRKALEALKKKGID